MRIKNLINLLFIILCLPLLIATDFSTNDYAPLSDLNFHHKKEHNLFIKYNDVHYTLNLDSWSQQERAPALYNLNREVILATKYLFKFAEKEGLEVSECRSNSNLVFFLVDFGVLNDEVRFSDWKKLAPNAKAIRALYSPWKQKYDTSIIVLTDQGRNETPIVIGHEVSHYWFDRFCWGSFWKGGNTEDFAQSFEAYYRKIR